MKNVLVPGQDLRNVARYMQAGDNASVAQQPANHIINHSEIQIQTGRVSHRVAYARRAALSRSCSHSAKCSIGPPPAHIERMAMGDRGTCGGFRKEGMWSNPRGRFERDVPHNNNGLMAKEKPSGPTSRALHVAIFHKFLQLNKEKAFSVA